MDNNTSVNMLTEEELNLITKKQRKMQERFRSVPDTGQYVEYLGKKFIVYKDVFWPFEDSKPLVENYTINQGDVVLDVCTGSGVIAVFSAYKGAKRVVAVDSSPNAIKTAQANAALHGFHETIDVKLSNLFTALKDTEQFDVITGNLPFRHKGAVDEVEATMWDTSLEVHKTFFREVLKYLKPHGRIYLSQANFGAVTEMKELAHHAGFIVRCIGEKPMFDDPRIFYAFELTKEYSHTP